MCLLFFEVATLPAYLQYILGGIAAAIATLVVRHEHHGTHACVGQGTGAALGLTKRTGSQLQDISAAANFLLSLYCS